jgi:hypothetical protein
MSEPYVAISVPYARIALMPESRLLASDGAASATPLLFQNKTTSITNVNSRRTNFTP